MKNKNNFPQKITDCIIVVNFNMRFQCTSLIVLYAAEYVWTFFYIEKELTSLHKILLSCTKRFLCKSGVLCCFRFWFKCYTGLKLLDPALSQHSALSRVLVWRSVVSVRSLVSSYDSFLVNYWRLFTVNWQLFTVWKRSNNLVNVIHYFLLFLNLDVLEIRNDRR